MDLVQIKDLRFKTIIGCWDWERQLPQQVSIDLDMAWSFTEAAKTEKLDYALNYKAVAQRVESYICESKFKLVETAAVNLADMLMDEFSILWVKVSFHKPFAVKHSQSVGVVIERGKRD
ncbi:MAG: dihydroneopterin aldolase [Pseudomonadota bacterium]|nr:dihydroneopterin aldolase [Pseudomonadota bacterium]